MASTCFVVSGRKGAGKDTVIPLAFDALGVGHLVDYVRLSDPLKDTLDEMIRLIRGSSSVGEAVVAVSSVDEDLSEQDVQHLVGLLYGKVHSDEGEHARSHSEEVVAALQFYGTDCKRAQDPLYWVRKAEDRILEVQGQGRIPCLMDARFPNEVTGLSRVEKKVVIRLEVSDQQQLARLQSRDGRTVSVQELRHESETALDNFNGFDIVVDTADSVEDTVEQLFIALLAHSRGQ